MRRTILLCVFVLLAASAAKDACAQHHGGGGSGFARSGSGFARPGPGFARPGPGFARPGPGFAIRGSGFARRGTGFNRARGASLYGFGYGYLPDDSGAPYGDASQPALYDQGPVIVQPSAAPAPPAGVTGHAVILEYKWPAADAASSPSAPSTTSEPQSFAIVLKDGSTLSAVTVFASDDGLHYVDPDGKHLLIAMSAIDRAASLKTNRSRNLNLYLPAVQ